MDEGKNALSAPWTYCRGNFLNGKKLKQLLGWKEKEN
jgi:hypothetical protein